MWAQPDPRNGGWQSWRDASGGDVEIWRRVDGRAEVRREGETWFAWIDGEPVRKFVGGVGRRSWWRTAPRAMAKVDQILVALWAVQR